MSFSKNPPWLVPSSTATPSLQAQIGLPNPMINFQPQAPPPPNISLINQMAAVSAAVVQAAPPQMYTQTVSYPAPRALNTIAYQQQQQPTHQQLQPQLHQQQQQQQQMSPQMNCTMPPGVGPMPPLPVLPSAAAVMQSNLMATQRAYTGTVTKIQADVGFIDDEIFFHKSVVCKGSMPKVGEHVFVEASYASNTPFKWNASRVQLLTPSGQVQSKSSYNNHNSSSENGNYSRGNMNTSSNNMRSVNHSSHRRSRSPPPRRSLDRSNSKRDSSDNDRRRRSARDERDKRERRDRGSSPPPKTPERRERRTSRPVAAATGTSSSATATATAASVGSPPPLKKRRRMVPRYMVQIPKVALAMVRADVQELKQRYQNLYIPSDFFQTEILWPETFTPDKPFVLRQPCSFHLMYKDIVPPPELANDESLLEPPDADHSFSARVMLMSVPPMSDIYRQCFSAAEEEEDSDRNLVHPSRTISFLMGLRGKNETMGIGGPWSPSLDGKNPESDPRVLIRTAIRTCKALTGIDLSRCTQWYRFVELYYHRRETGRVHTVVVYMPDVRSCIPTAEEWQGLRKQYKMALQRVLDQNHNSSSPKTSNSNPDSSSSISSARAETAAKEKKKEEEKPAKAEEKEKTDEGAAEKATAEEEEQQKDDKMETSEAEQGDETKDEKADAQDQKTDKTKAAAAAVDDKAEEPTISTTDTEMTPVEPEEEEEDVPEKIDPKAMKISELKEELIERNLPTKGLKAELVERLTEALAKEIEEKETKDEVIAPVKEDSNSNQSMEGEPDLANMIVIDECCDPTKAKQDENAASPAEEGEVEQEQEQEQETEKPTPTKEVKKFDEKDIRHLQRRYTLPESPEIIVHPSKTAKGGKFDCSVMSLSVLLDYNPEDAKEHSFEVYLFAEIFNEMLMRDSAFNIYTALQGLPERKEVDEDRKEGAAVKGGKDEKKDKKSSTTEEEKQSGKDTATTDTTVAASSDSKKRDKERKKQITVNPELLLSFAYFDQTHCGYVLCKDLEDLFSTIGLSLSKDQIRKVVRRGAVTDSLYYRKLTDKDKEEAEGQPTASKESTVATCSSIAKGNATLMPVFKSATANNDNGGAAAAAAAKTSSMSTAVHAMETETETGLVMHNGTLLNVEKMVERIKAAERALLDTEQVLADVKKENSELSASSLKSQTKIKDLSSDLKSTMRKLTEAESSVASLQRKNGDYLSVLTTISDKVSPWVKKEKKEERSSSRNTADGKDKEKEKDKDKDREVKVEVKQEAKSSGSATADEATVKKEK